MKKLLPLLLLSACTHGAVHVENDFLNPLQKNSDKFYTHGTQLGYSEYEDDKKTTYSIGQTIFTPSQKKSDADTEVLKRDRPYTGWLYGEFRKDIRVDADTIQTYGLQLGCTGPCSYARQSQTQVHKLLNQHIPTWDENFSLKSEPGVLLFLQRGKEIYGNDNSDLQVVGGVKLGNIIDSGSLSAIGRMGYNLEKFPSSQIVFKASKDDEKTWSAYVFLKGEERGVAYNHLLEGSLWQTERHTVDAEPFVTEGDLGFSVGYGDFHFSYTYTIFSNEWKERPGAFAFGGVDFTW